MTRVPGFLSIHTLDVFVDAKTDERFYVRGVKVAARIRQLPIVYEVQLAVAPFTDTVYSVEVGGEDAGWRVRDPRDCGTGTVTVSHDYGGPDALAYQTADACGIEGATVHVYPSAYYLANTSNLDPTLAVASTYTTANGRWAYAIKLDPGDYYLVFHKPGESGPDAAALTVTDE
jgi:hypothetical protein